MGSKYVQVTFRFHDMFSAPMEKAAAKMKRMNDTISANHKKISDYGKAVTREGQKISKMGSSLTKNVTMPIVGISTVSGKLAMDFGKRMAQINTLLDDDSHLKGYEKAVLATSDKLGIDANTSAEGLYQTISTLGDHGKTTEKTFHIMAQASKAGGAEVVDAVNMIATAMNGYGKTSDETAQRISDLSFKTVKLGKTTFPELANSMSSLFPLGKSLNISYEELYATMSTATTSFAGNTAEASTQIKGLMTGFLKPSKEMQALIEASGYSSGAAMIKAKGLAGALEYVQKHAGKDGMSKYFKNVRGLTAALGLSGKGMDKYKKHLKEMKNATGATGDALKKMGETDAAKFNKALVRLQNAGIKFGAAVLPVITPMVTKLGNAISKAGKWFSSLSKEQQNMIVKGLMVAAVLGPMLKIIGGVTTKVGGAISFFGKFGKAMEAAGSFGGALVKMFPIAGRAILGVGKVFATVGKLFLTNPIGIAITAIGIAAVLLWKNWDKVKPHLKPVFDLMKKGAEVFKQFAAAAKKQFKKAVEGIKDFAEGVKKKFAQVKGFFKNMANAVVTFKSNLTSKFKAAVAAVTVFAKGVASKFSWVKGYFSGVIQFVTGVFTGNWKKAWQGVVKAFSSIFEGIKGAAKAPLNAVIGLVNSAIAKLNKFHIDVPDALGGGSVGFNIPSIPKLYKGTMDWKGGLAMVHDRGGEIINLPKHSQVIPHDISREMVREGGSKTINIHKLADKMVVRNDQDIDKIAETIVRKLEMLEGDVVYG